MNSLLLTGTAAILAASCIPRTEADLPSGCNEELVSYSEAPESLRTPRLTEALTRFVTLAGRWRADLVCPPGDSTVKRVEFSLSPDSIDTVEVVTGCRAGDNSWAPEPPDFRALAQCGVSITSPDLNVLDQQTTDFRVSLLTDLWKVEISQFLDPSKDPSLGAIHMAFLVGYDDTITAGFTFSFKPQKTTEGGMSVSGYDCEMTNLVKIGT